MKSYDDYTKERDSFCTRYPGFEKEIPVYGQFMEVFYSAGILPLKEIQDYFSSLVKSRDMLQGSKPLWIG